MTANKPTSTAGFSKEYFAVVETVYLIKLNRIGRGLTPEEVSFLIGRPKNYMLRIESDISHKGFTVKDLFRMALVFRMPLQTLFMNSPYEFDKINVRASVTEHDGITIHTAEKLGNDGSPELLYKLYEYNTPPSESVKQEDEDQLRLLTQTIQKFIRAKYFDKKGRSPLEIYTHCKKSIRTYIRPCLLEKALDFYCKRREKPVLKKCLYPKEGYIYIKAGRQGIIKSKK